ncbi:MAG: phage tail tube protein [Pseudomonadota bacterium]
MPIQTQVATKVIRKKETTYGTLAGASGAREFRKVSDSLQLKKNKIQSNAIQTNAQRPLGRHGGRMVDGNMSFEMALGLIEDLIGSVVRRDWTAVTPLTGLTVTASATGPHFVRSTGSWLTDGLAVGMLVKFTGFTSGAAVNNGVLFTIIALTALNMSVAETVVAASSTGSIGLTVPGKITYIPETGHTNDSYTVEKYYATAGESYRFTGDRVASINFGLNADDKVSAEVAWMGQNRTKDVTQYFTSPAAPGGGDMLVSPSGLLVINAVATKVCTNFTLSINGNASVGKVVGANVTPDVFMDMIDVGGQVSVYYQDGVVDTYFDDEVTISLINRLDDGIGGAFVMAMPVVKLFGGGESGDKEIIRQYDYSAGPNVAGTGAGKSTILLQDTTL